MPSRRYDTSVTLQLKLTRLAAELPLNAYDFCISYIIPSYALYPVQTSEFWTSRML
jgi:hypothetical protein